MINPRLRIVKSAKKTEFIFLIQTSLDGLTWWPIKEARSMEESIGYAKDISLVANTRWVDRHSDALWEQNICK